MKKIYLLLLSLIVFGTMMAQNSAERCPHANNNPVNGTDIQWDVMWTFNTTTVSQAGVETDGNHIYCPKWNAETIVRYDMDGVNPTEFTIAGVTNLRDLAYDGAYFYGASANMALKVMDFENETLIATINASCSGITGIRHIAYDPTLDGGNGGFWIGNWYELGAIDMEGNQLIADLGSDLDHSYGSAYDDTDPDNPVLWIFQQNGNEYVTFHEFDINTLSYTGVTHDASDVPRYQSGSGTLAGGACIWDDPVSGLKLLIGVIQQTPNLVFAYELSGGPEPLTYDMALLELDMPMLAKLNDEIQVMGKVKNRGIETVTSFDVSYTIDGGSPIVSTISGVSIATSGVYDFVADQPMIFDTEGTYEIVVTIENINGNIDEDPSNNTLTHFIGIVPFVPEKRVFGEEATGTWCGWCPRGIVAMDYMAATYPDTWIGVAVHNSDPMVNTVYDNGIAAHISGYPNLDKPKPNRLLN